MTREEIYKLFSGAGLLQYALATIDRNGEAVACLDCDDRLFPLSATARRFGLSNMGHGVAELFANWEASAERLARLTELVASAPELALQGPVTRLAPLLYPGKIACAGANYYDHLAEMGMPGAKKEDQRLFFFLKPPRNAVVGPGRTVHMPFDTQKLDWEVELALVIGRRARAVSAERALDHVAAYTVAIDFSARDLNMAPATFYKLDWVAGKAQDTGCPMGPGLVPASFLGNPQDLGLTLDVNGERKQDGRTSGMVFSIAEQIAILSRIMTLDPGDVVLTGTPAGVGLPKGTFLKVGDKVDAAIEGIGTLSVEIGPSG